MPFKSSSHHPPISRLFGKARSPGGQRLRAPEAEPNITDEHFDSLLELLNRVRKRNSGGPLPETDHAVLRDRLEELAALFLLRQCYLKSGQTPTSKKHALKRLKSAADRFIRALEDIDHSTWVSLYMRLQDPPEGFAEAISTYAMGSVGADSKDLYRHFQVVAAIGEAADETRAAIPKARSARRTYEAVRWLVTGGFQGSKLGLAFLYKEVTGRRATAYSSPNYSKSALGKRATPFVRFVAEFIRPFAPELCTASLGEAIFTALRPKNRARRGSHSKK